VAAETEPTLWSNRALRVQKWHQCAQPCVEEPTGTQGALVARAVNPRVNARPGQRASARHVAGSRNWYGSTGSKPRRARPNARERGAPNNERAQAFELSGVLCGKTAFNA